jgi:hypothetical protein
LDALVLRPSVVYSAAGSYGGTSLLRALAALPGVLLLPGSGLAQIQPLAAEDLAELVRRALQDGPVGCYEVGGPQRVSLREYLVAWRDWLRLPRATEWRVPTLIVSCCVAIAERVGRGPLGATIWRMLQRGNVAAPDAAARLQRDFSFAPRALSMVLATRPSQVQDRWQAQLYLIAPLLRSGVVLLFLISAWTGFATPAAEIERLSAGSALAAWHPVMLARGAAMLDLILGLMLLVGAYARAAIAAMLALVAIYSFVFGVLLPELWLDPLGGLAKNLVLLPALAALWVLSGRRGR